MCGSPVSAHPTSQEASETTAATWSVQRDAGILAPHLQTLKSGYTGCFNLTKVTREGTYQRNIWLYKMPILRMIHALHGHLVPDSYSARYLNMDQECSALGGGCFVLRFIYRISP